MPFSLKVRRKGETRWRFLTEQGSLTWNATHAVQYGSRNVASAIAQAMLKKEPGAYEIRCVPASKHHEEPQYHLPLELEQE